MRNLKRNILIVTGLLVVLFRIAPAQEEAKTEIPPVRYFIGIHPGLSIIPFDEYNRSAFDINLIPITLEYAMNRNLSFRLHSIWDLQVRPEFPAVRSTTGIEIALPYYFSKKNSEEGQRGFYGAPVLTPAFHRLNQFYSLGLGIEAGYALLFGYRWSFIIGVQGGFKLQYDPDNPFMRILFYSLPKVGIGIWL
jgi:hypothetical protein